MNIALRYLYINKTKKNMIPEILRQKIEIKFGKKIKYQKDCKALAAGIEKLCNEKISYLTIERCFGLITYSSSPSNYTIDLLARYVGISDWRTFIGLNKNRIYDYFENIDTIISSNLTKGQLIYLTYYPDRKLKLQYEGDLHFKVIELSECNLMVGDMLHILRLEVNFPFVCEYVLRNGAKIGKFVGGKEGEAVSNILSLELVASPPFELRFD
jgi:hypothetical protein